MEGDFYTRKWYSQRQSSSKWDDNRLVEYMVGNSPIILSVPHGGVSEAGLPDRPAGCHVQDAYSLELALDTAKNITHVCSSSPLPIRRHASSLPSSPLPHTHSADVLVEEGPQYPHIVISHLKRSKMDPNRDKEAACMGNCVAEEAWDHYHGFITEAIEMAWKKYGYAHVFDVHGQSHRPDALELGYCLTGMDLNLTDEELNLRAGSLVSSPHGIRHSMGALKTDEVHLECSLMTMFHRLICANMYSCDCTEDFHCVCCGRDKLVVDDASARTSHSSLSFSELVRGADSLGALLTKRGYPAVPSPSEPKVFGQYFWGAFTTRCYGLHYSHDEKFTRVAMEACVNSTQLEPPLYMREPKERGKFSRALAEAIVIWMARWYGHL